MTVISSVNPLKRLRNDSGSVLIVTLLIIVTLVTLTVAFTEETSVELHLAGYARDSFRAYQAARSGVHRMLDAIDRDENAEVDGFRDGWADVSGNVLSGDPAHEVSVTGIVSDESGKFNLNFLLNAEGEIDPEREQQLYRLLRALAVDENLAAPILDWLDADDIERMNGAENAYYQNLAEPYACNNGPFPTSGQFLRVKGFAQAGLMDYVTVYSDGLININTASREVLQTLSEALTPLLADAVIAFRETADFITVEDLNQVAGMDATLFNEIKDRISVRSAAFSIEYEGRYRNTAAVITAVATRTQKKVSLLYWRVD